MTKEKIKHSVLELIGDLLEILDAVPLIDYTKPLGDMNHNMKYSLAQFYSDNGLRAYLEHKINENTRNSAEKGEDPIAIAFNRGRLSMLKEIYRDGREFFQKVEQLRPLAQRMEHLNASKELKNEEVKEKG